MNIQRFEEIVAWQRARLLTQEIYRCAKTGPFAKDFGLRDQIQRATVSAMSNIAEGFERGGNREFVQFLSTSKGSCGEVKSHLYVALDQNYINQGLFDRVYGQAEEVSRLIGGFMTYLRQSERSGHKFVSRRSQ